MQDRVVFARNNNADIFISIHLDGAVNQQLNGFSVLVDKDNSENNLLLASALIAQIKKSYKTEEKVGTRNHGVWVLDQNSCPAAMVRCGFITNANDAVFISKSADQEKIAKNILDAINDYASSAEAEKDGSFQSNSDSNNPKLISVTLTKSDGTKISANEDIIENSEHATFNGKNPIIIFNGNEIPADSLKGKNINAKKIIVYFPNDKKGLQLYGEKAKNGIKVYEDASMTNEFELINLKLEKVPSNTQKRDTIPAMSYTNALFVIDGKISTNEKAKAVDPQNIESIILS